MNFNLFNINFSLFDKQHYYSEYLKFKENTYLHLTTAVYVDMPTDSKIVKFSRQLENFSNYLLKDARCLLKGRKITVNSDEILLIEENKPLKNVIQKIIRLVKVALLTLPGLLLKNFSLQIRSLIEYSSYPIDLKEYLSNPKKYHHRIENQRHRIVFKNLINIIPQTQQHVFSKLPSDLQHHTLSFLDDPNRLNFALSCKQNYQVAANFYRSSSYQDDFYPLMIMQTLQTANIKNVPLISLSSNSLNYLFKIKKFMYELHFKRRENNLDWEVLRRIELNLLVNRLFVSSSVQKSLEKNILKNILEKIENNSVMEIQTNTGFRGLLIRIHQNNFLNPNLIDENSEVGSFSNQGFLVITKSEDKWLVMGLNILEANKPVILFLNNLFFDCTDEQVENYLRRLLKEEACGCHVINDEKVRTKESKRIDFFEESDRYCSDKITPLICLWKSIKIESV